MSDLTIEAQASFSAMKPGSIQFLVESGEVLRFEHDGRCFVRGEQVDDNQEVYRILKLWLATIKQPARFDEEKPPTPGAE